jgi:ubiquinone/menaquinone biosynthesis C-methylase UbiE
MFNNTTSRFAHTVENYVKYRPGYPKTMVDFLQTNLNLTSQAVVVDVGSGTGKSSEPFLHLGNRVYGVEPNAEMRQAAEQLLGHFPNFTSISGRAEATTLPDRCADFLVAGTAFHWFEPTAAHREFQRILKPGGWILLVWNVRNLENSAFMQAYDRFLLKYSTDYQQVKEVYNNSADFDAFFGNNNWQKVHFENRQTFDFESLVGRYRSSSFALSENHPNFAAAKNALQRLFEQYQENGQLTFLYQTVLYYGKIRGGEGGAGLAAG